MHRKNTPVQVNDVNFDSVADAAEHFNISCKDAVKRLNQGMSPEKAFGVPKKVSSFERPENTLVGSDMPAKTMITKKPVICGTDQFASIAAFARHLELNPREVGRRLKNGESPEDIAESVKPQRETLHLGRTEQKNDNAPKEQFRISGKTFSSVDELSEHYHVPANKIRRHLRHGWSAAQAVGVAPKPPESPVGQSGAITLTVDNKSYRNVAAVAKAHKLDVGHLSALLAQGYQCEAAVHALLSESENIKPQTGTQEGSIKVHGKQYDSERAAAKAHGIALSTYYQRRRNGSSIEEALIPKSKGHHRAQSITCNGKTYDSMRALARAYKMSPHKLRYRIEQAKMTPEDAVKPKLTKKKTTNKAGNGKAIIFQNKRYPSLKAFADAFGIGVNTLSYRLKNGWTRAEAVGLVTRSNNKTSASSATANKRETFTYKKKTYRSVRALAAAFNQPVHKVRYRLKKGLPMAQVVGDEAIAKKQAVTPPREGLINISEILPIKLQGKTFQSASALAKHYKLNPDKVTGRLRNGWTVKEAVELTERKTVRKSHASSNNVSLRVGKRQFSSVKALALHFKQHYTTVRRRLQQGASAAQAVGKVKWIPPSRQNAVSKGKSVSYQGKDYPSYQALATAFSLSYNQLMGRLHRGWTLSEAITGERNTTSAQVTGSRAASSTSARTKAKKMANSQKDKQSLVGQLLPEMNQVIKIGNLSFSSVEDFAEHLSLDPMVTLQRLNHGWSPEQIAGLSVPPNWAN